MKDTLPNDVSIVTQEYKDENLGEITLTTSSELMDQVFVSGVSSNDT
jgi:hypothetical protein